MSAITCSACGHVNDEEAETCTSCSTALAWDRRLLSLNAASDRLRAVATEPTSTFYSTNGFGTMLLDYRSLPDGLYRTTRWVTAAGLPLVPLGDYVIRPALHRARAGSHQHRFTVIRREPIDWARAARMIAWLVALLAPGLAFLFGGGEWLEDQIGGPWTVAVGLLAIAWAIGVLMRIHSTSDAYDGLDSV